MLARHERHLIARYLWPGAGGRLVLLVAAIGCTGVMIGVAALVLVIAVMNGAQTRLADSVAPVDGHLSITVPAGARPTEAQVAAAIARIAGVIRTEPIREITAGLSIDGRITPITLQGRDPRTLYRLVPTMRSALAHSPDPASAVAIGQTAALQLGLFPGDRIAIGRVVLGPDRTLSLDLTPARVATFYLDDDKGGDRVTVYAPLDSLPILQNDSAVTRRVAVVLADATQEAAVTAAIRRRLGPAYPIISWQQANRALLAALVTEKIGMTIAVGLVTLVALFNILSSMTLLARAKRREIAILRTMGVTARSIMRIFATVGSIIALIGAGIGLSLAAALLTQRGAIVAAVRHLSPARQAEWDVFLSLPIGISARELAVIALSVLAGAVLASLYPAWRAGRTSPALVLRAD
ncbi:FtsX-like permease family protein [Sphingomonas yabuuchiae]|uniref:ABC transporter permease n=1 Tax=Sphingomonas yabuuchiae TaxID=172044 RepID=A0AA41DCL0_9SPHN|nr:FtsX-like permease family protein [Sphingomonas yabuuchiae]MBB4607897.1 lipoprotein-releasing system permease protein [Sphingomonas yabuuchiae]MBN3559571.1 ABC transporter permease [Sphingomonas yabuuchiae]